MTGDEAAPPGAASYVYAAGARSRAGVAKGIADMQNKVDEVFVGKVRLLSIEGERSGIVKTPAAGPLMLTPTGLEGDEQADLRHHGGVDKALHHYPVEHYAVLAAEWPQCAAAVGAGFLGENISTRGLDEHALCIGDVLRIGEARVQVSQTRSPCWKIDLRLKIDVDVVLEGRVELGDGVVIGPFTRLKDVTLAAGTQVRAHCDLEGVASEGAALIGPYARLRPGTVLADGVHVGNFVETKNARIGMGSKANHLTYLGDAVIGTGTNIGAGTITCNYDGVNKSTTTIGDRVFVGSNSSLVAPVTLADGATIGAGSVISKNAPADKLTVARARQMTVEGWQRPMKK